MGYLLFMNLLLLSLGLAQAHSELSSQEIQDWLDAVVLLTNNGAFCSGALIDEEGTVLTAYHCVASGRQTTVQTRSQQT